jgi:hypothetical protein
VPISFSGSNNAAPLRNPSRRGGVPSVGGPSALVAPGVATIPPVPSGGFDAGQLIEVARAAGDLVQTIGIQNYRARQAEEAESRRIEADSKEAQTLLRGQGSERAQVDLPQILADIDTRKLVPSDDEYTNPQAMVDRLARERLGNENETLVEGWKRQANGPISAALAKVRVQQHAAMKERAISAGEREAVNATTPEELTAARDALIAAGVDENDAHDATYLSALNNAAEAGDDGRMAMVMSQIDQATYQTEVRRAQAKLSQAKAAQQTVANRASDARFYSGLDLMKQNKVSVTHMSKLVDREAPNVSAEVTMRRRDAVREVAEAQLRESIRNADQAAEMAAAEQYQSYALGLAASGNLQTLQEAEVELPSGKTFKPRKREAQEGALAAQMEAAAKDGPPETADNRRIDVARKNGMVPFGWQPAMEIGYTSMAPQDLTSGGEPNVNARTLQGFALFKQLSVQYPQALTGLTTESRRFYETAMGALSNPMGSTVEPIADQQALLYAARQMRAPAKPVNLVADQKKSILNWAADSTFNAINSEVIGAQVSAEVERLMGTMNANDAMERVKAKYEGAFVKINGFATAVFDPSIKDGQRELIGMAGEKIVREHAAANPDQLLDPNRLTMMRAPNVDEWFIVDDKGWPVVAGGKVTRYSTAELVKRGEALAVEQANLPSYWEGLKQTGMFVKRRPAQPLSREEVLKQQQERRQRQKGEASEWLIRSTFP